MYELKGCKNEKFVRFSAAFTMGTTFNYAVEILKSLQWLF